MTHSSGIPIWRKLPPTIKSILVHIAVVSGFGLKTVFFPSESIDIQSAIRVDIVDLPDKIVEKPMAKPAEEEKKAAPIAEVKKEVAPPPKKKAISLEKKPKVNTKSAIERTKALEKIENMLAAEREAKVKKQLYKGNVVSKGSQLDGIAKLQYDDYIDRLDSHVKQYWSIPSWLANLNLRARITVKLSPEGYVKSRIIILSSGNTTYDEYVIASIDKASPFPPPSEKFVDVLSQEGLTLGFPD